MQRTLSFRLLSDEDYSRVDYLTQRDKIKQSTPVMKSRSQIFPIYLCDVSRQLWKIFSLMQLKND